MDEVMKVRLIRYIGMHGVKAYGNEVGTITMENRFFDSEEVEYVEVKDLREARIQLGY